MSRNEQTKVMSARRVAILRALPDKEAKAIGGAEICKSLNLTPVQFRYMIDLLWAKNEIGYSGETRARVYWRKVAKPAAPKSK